MNAYIFDVDGVITNPHERRITNPEITKHLIEMLLNNLPVGIVSGRALPWLKERVVSELEKYMRDNNLNRNTLDNLFVSGEFGGSSIIFENGEPAESINPDIKLDPKFVEKAREITSPFSDFVFVDEEKQTQFTAEMQNGIAVEEFHKHRDEIANSYKELVKEFGLEEILEVHSDRIAINIKHKIANKMFATGEFLNWLGRKNILIDEFRVFGDSPSDLEMGDELKKRGLPFDFIYVGDPEEIKSKIGFTPIFTVREFNKKTDEGTLEYLTSNNN